MARATADTDPQLDNKQAIEFGTKQLDRVLTFFPRVDARINSLSALVIGMLGILVINFRKGDHLLWYLSLPFLCTATLATLALYYLYRASFPTLEGGDGSVIYFRSINSMTELNYVGKTLSLTEKQLAQDLLGQAWRNSQILSQKYENVRRAFFVSIATLVFWIASMLLSAIEHGHLLTR